MATAQFQVSDEGNKVARAYFSVIPSGGASRVEPSKMEARWSDGHIDSASYFAYGRKDHEFSSYGDHSVNIIYQGTEYDSSGNPMGNVSFNENVNFTLNEPTYYLNFEASPSNLGTVSVQSSSFPASGGSTTCYAYPNEGVEFVEWRRKSDNFVVSTQSAEGFDEYDFKSGTYNETFVAFFQEMSGYENISSKPGPAITNVEQVDNGDGTKDVTIHYEEVIGADQYRIAFGGQAYTSQKLVLTLTDIPLGEYTAKVRGENTPSGTSTGYGPSEDISVYKKFEGLSGDHPVGDIESNDINQLFKIKCQEGTLPITYTIFFGALEKKISATEDTAKIEVSIGKETVYTGPDKTWDPTSINLEFYKDYFWKVQAETTANKEETTWIPFTYFKTVMLEVLKDKGKIKNGQTIRLTANISNYDIENKINGIDWNITWDTKDLNQKDITEINSTTIEYTPNIGEDKKTVNVECVFNYTL